MKKALLYSVTAALLVASLAGCAKEQAQEPPAADPSPSVSATAEPSPAPEAAEPKAETLSNETTPENTPESPTVESTAPETTDEPAQQEPDLFTDVDETVYAQSTVNIRSGPSLDYEKAGGLKQGESIHRTGIGTGEAEGWSEVEMADGSTAYIKSSYLSTTKPEAKPASTPKPSSNSSNKSNNNSNAGTSGGDGGSSDGGTLFPGGGKNGESSDEGSDEPIKANGVAPGRGEELDTGIRDKLTEEDFDIIFDSINVKGS